MLAGLAGSQHAVGALVLQHGGSKGRLDMFESPMHILIVAIVILVLFGGRKIPELMRGMGEGVRGFKEGMSGTPPQTPTPPPQATPPAEKPPEEKK